MPINSEWTKFSSEELAYMDKQMADNMELYNLEQEVMEHEKALKLSGRGYFADKTVWKSWTDSIAHTYAVGIKEQVEEVISANNKYTTHQIMFPTHNNPFAWLWSLAKYVLEKKAISKKEKKLCLDISKRFSAGASKAFRSRSYNRYHEMAFKWLSKNIRELRTIFNVKRLRDKEVGTNDTFMIGNITIHNSIGASESIIEKMKQQITRAVRYIKGGDLAEMKKVLYGHAHLVNESASGHNVLGFYNKDEDNVYVRVYLRGKSGNYVEKEGGYIQVLIHELGHRCYKKFISNDFKMEWRAYYNSILQQGVKDFPEEGEKLWFTSNGEVVYFKELLTRSRVRCVLENGKEALFGIKNFARAYRQSQQQLNFPTRYSMTNQEEFFCEAISLYLMGLLNQKFYTKTRKIFGIAEDAPRPDIQENQNQDEESQEQSEGIDFKDQLISMTVTILNDLDPVKVGNQYFKSTSFQPFFNKIFATQFIKNKMKEFAKKGVSPQAFQTLMDGLITDSVTLGVEQGKFEVDNNNIWIDVTELYQDNDQNDSEVEQLVAEKWGSQMQILFDLAEDSEPLERTLLQLVGAVGDVLSRDGLTVDVSVISDIIKERLDTLIGISSLSTGGKGARVEKKGNKYVFSNVSIVLTESVDVALFTDYMENVQLENLGRGEDRTLSLEDLKFLVEASADWGGETPVSDDGLKIKAINEYFNHSRFTDRYNLRINGDQYIITRKPKVDSGTTPSTAPKEKVNFLPMNELQTNIMKEVCALLKGGNGDLTASDVYKSMGDRVGSVSLRGFGRSMGKLVRLNYLCPNGKCQKGSIYKLSETGTKWCQINGVTIAPKNPTQDEPQGNENSVENSLVKELRDLYQLVQPLGNEENTKMVVAIGRAVKKDLAEKLSSIQVRKISKLVKELNLDVSSLPLIKSQLIVGESADDEEITPLVMELRKLYVDVRKAGVHKRSLTILTRIATKVKEDDLNEVVGDELIALKRLIERAELNSADYPLIFKVVEQTSDEDKADESDSDLPAVTEVMKIILRVMGVNTEKEESASSIREKVNKFPDTNVTTKGLGRTMGAMVRYGYLAKTGKSPSGTTYKATALLSRWYRANSSNESITDLGMDILRAMGSMPNLPTQNSTQMHTLLSASGSDATTRGVGRSMGKLARDGFLVKNSDKSYSLSDQGKQWFYNDLAK